MNKSLLENALLRRRNEDLKESAADIADQRDRYREALEKIAAGDFHEDGDIAREALGRGGEQL